MCFNKRPRKFWCTLNLDYLCQVKHQRQKAMTEKLTTSKTGREGERQNGSTKLRNQERGEIWKDKVCPMFSRHMEGKQSAITIVLHSFAPILSYIRVATDVNFYYLLMCPIQYLKLFLKIIAKVFKITSF